MRPSPLLVHQEAQEVHWIISLFGAFLIFTGIRMGLKRETEVHPDTNPFIRFVRRLIPITADDAGERFL